MAISVEANQYHLDDSDMVGFEDLLDYCNGLVISDGQAIRLVHFSVRNYLDRHQVIPEDAKETYHVIACCTVLSFDVLKECDCDPSFNIIDGLPFLDYSANNLTFHLSKVERGHYPETTSAVMKLLESQGHRHVYYKINSDIKWQCDIPRLNSACAIGYEDAVRALLSEGEVEINAKDPPAGLASLLWAVLMGHEEVVRRLLGEKLGWSCNGTAPLSIAIGRQRTGILRLLLEMGVEANSAYNEVSQFGYNSTQFDRC